MEWEMGGGKVHRGEGEGAETRTGHNPRIQTKKHRPSREKLSEVLGKKFR